MSDTLTFNGREFAEFGVFFDGSKSFVTPEKDVEFVEVPGRNGSLSFDNKRFNDLEITYPCFVRGNFLSKFREFEQFLYSTSGYQRLECSKEPNHYRMAQFVSMIEPRTTAFNKSGFFEITFRCHPQRFLKSGETATDVTPSSTTSSGSTVSVPNPSGLSAVTDLKVNIEPIQEGEGDPSPTNVRPISGHTQATVYRVGKNLLPNNWVTRTTNGVTFTPQSNGRVRVYGTATDYTTYSDSFVWTGDTGVYFFNGCPDGSATTFDTFVYDADAGQRARKRDGVTPCDSCYSGSQEVLLTKGTRYLYVIRVFAGQTMTQQLFAPMIRRSADDAYYDSYQGTEYTIDLNGTIYGGQVDFTTGVMTVTHRFITFANITTWAKNASYANIFNGTLPARALSGASAEPISDTYKTTTSATIMHEENGVAVANNDSTLYVKDSRFSEVADFVEATKDVELVYKLVTHQTVQLTAQQISLLQGSNYINASTGDVEITVSTPGSVTNPTLFESKPIIRMYGNGTVNLGNVTITVSNSPFDFIDLDCETMDAHYGSGNANPYVSISTDDFITLKPGENYVTYSGFTVVRITPRWYEI